MATKYVIEVTVSNCWVDDGFNIEKALDKFRDAILPYAYDYEKEVELIWCYPAPEYEQKEG